ncbi:MAG: hypothetical protein ACQCN5_07465 [Candidatus Bathyarchaeia archaeon]|jgi:hypothetical protein
MYVLIAISFVLSFSVIYGVRRYLEGDRLSSGDTFYHLWLSKLLRTNKFRYPTAIPNVEFLDADEHSKYLIYPPLMHYIVACFPVKYHQRIAKLFNPLIVSVLSSLAAVICYNLTSNYFVAFLASFIVLFNLAAYEIASGFTPRPLGLLWYSFLFYVVLFYPLSILSFIAVSVFVMLIAFSHKFALQVLTFVLVPYCLIFGQPLYLAALIVGLIFALLVSRGFYLKILKEHVKWLIHYARHPHFLPTPYISHIKGIFARNTWYLLFPLAIIILFLEGNSLWLFGLNGKIVFLALAPLIVSFFVALPKLAFIGEDYRYIEYAIIPVACSVSVFIVFTGWNLFLIIGGIVSLAASFFGLRLYKKYLINSKFLVDDEEINIVFPQLKNVITGPIMVLPFYRALEASYYTELKTIHLVRIEGTSAELVDILINKCFVEYLLFFKEFTDAKAKGVYDYLSKNNLIVKIEDFKNIELYKIVHDAQS